MKRIMMAGLGLLMVVAIDAKIPGVTAASPQIAQTSTPYACSGALQGYVRTSLYMERNMAQPGQKPRPITDKQWQKFMREVLVQHLPEGGTVLENYGWWRDPKGVMSGGKGVTVIVSAPVAQAAAHREAVHAVVEEMKRRFQQQSVLWEEDAVCSAF